VDDFFESIAHDDHWLMGRKLRPFCPWHRVWLNIVKSPLEAGGSVGLPDLEIFSRICSSDYAGVRKAIRRTPFSRFALLWKMFRYKIPSQLELLNEYIKDYVSVPDMWRNNNGHSTGKPLGGLPDSLYQVVAYQAATRLPPSVCWMTPIGEIEWWLATSRRIKGEDVEIVTDQDIAMMEQITAIKVKLAAEREAKLKAKQAAHKTE